MSSKANKHRFPLTNIVLVRCPDCGGPIVVGERSMRCPICGFTELVEVKR